MLLTGICLFIALNVDFNEQTYIIMAFTVNTINTTDITTEKNIKSRIKGFWLHYII